MPKFTVTNVGQIIKASVSFGDLTVLVGAQGTGKSIFLQLFKLCADQDYIKTLMSDHGQTWNKKSKPEFIEAYLGEGTQQMWRENSRVSVSKPYRSFSPSYKKTLDAAKERVFYIPAQRALAMPYGWPSPFRSYNHKTPFVVKNFSENIRLYLENAQTQKDELFPMPGRLKQEIREALNNAIFHNASVFQEGESGQKEMRLHIPTNSEDASGISYIAWSAGQREFTPLLVGCYKLLPGGKKSKDSNIDWVIIEEPEMGLHPMAVFSIMALAVDLLSRGYKVIISTHSPSVLDIVWAVKEINSTKKLDIKDKTDLCCKLFNLPPQPQGGALTRMMESLLNKALKTYYFNYDSDMKVNTTDISTLDPGSDDPVVSGWGGLSGYSGHAADIVAEAITRSQNGKAE